MENEKGISKEKETASGHKKTDPVLPPLKNEENNSSTGEPVDGISPTLKKGIIGFTAITVLIFGVFGTLLIKKLLSPGKETRPENHEVLTVAERLHQAGLEEQALEQYEKFLVLPGIGRETRAKVSFDTGKLYLKLDNCAEGLVYFFQSQVAFPKAPWAAELTSHIDHCLTRLNQSPPK
ncbi:MAG: hypothetical protein G3M70_15375 [Candidatus Nitronauta litoralis]|uniref:Tetratricopeptide repeat protein n=1 Tax=Candidatus Nitronauta litoralis TaxID=2705533 RepID=A0A7T0BY98_9BACT|nr:MAG: hypothetical protein G3M70_15375 [Candidatus Nitronauta litoralis]